jgi:hypothetical protein
MIRRLVLVSAVAPALSAAEKITYDDQEFPIFQQSCTNCHNPDKKKGGLDLSSYGGALAGGSGGKVVEPGDPSSRLISALMPGAEKPMPPEGEKLPKDKIEILKQWIVAGLLENSTSSARKPAKPKFEVALRSDPSAKPAGPPPMPRDVLLEPVVVTGRAAAVRSIAASPWAPLLAVTGEGQILLYHTENLELAGILPFPEGKPVSLTFTPDARYLIAGGGVPGKSGVTVTFDVTDGARLMTVAKEFDSVLAADIHPDFGLVATGGPSRLLKLWNTATGDLAKSIKKHTDWITALDISNDGVLLASGDRNGGVWVWEAATGNEFHTLRGHQAAISSLAFRADSNILATASEDGSVRYWEMNGGGEVRKNDAHSGGVTAFAFARDGSSLTAGRDMKVKWWNPDFSHARDLAQNLPALPTACAVDFEGKIAFVADAKGTLRAWQTADGKALGEISTNPPAIATRLASFDKEIAAAADKPETVAQLATARRKWAAAGINAQALASRAEAEKRAAELLAAQLDFRDAAAATTAQAAVLHRKRAGRDDLARLLARTAPSDGHRSELEATLIAIDLRLARELETFASLQARQQELRQRIETTAPPAQRQTDRTRDLLAAYRQALQ